MGKACQESEKALSQLTAYDLETEKLTSGTL
jgi:hypothetical protein